MNAPASNPSADRDLEALRRAQRAHEPSMEEILASIRSIIADERTPPPRPTVVAAPQTTFANDAPISQPAETRAPEPAPVVAGPKIVWQKPEVEPQAEEPASEPPAAPEPVAAPEAQLPPPQEAPEAAEEEPLTSPETDAAVSNAFDALQVSLVMQNSAMIEGVVREMIRPMLKAWLDDNLPSLVERLVRAEIQRVARGGR